MSDWKSKVGLAEMLKGGVIMDVVDAAQARIAEDAGAAAVMALERVPAQIRKDGGVARASDPQMISEIQAAVSIPVMAKCRIGHFVEAQILEALEVDFLDESEVLTPADDEQHIDKRSFAIPFVCGCRDLGEALRRIHEGAAMIRTKGEAGTGNIVEAVRHLRALGREMHETQRLRGAAPARSCSSARRGSCGWAPQSRSWIAIAVSRCSCGSGTSPRRRFILSSARTRRSFTRACRSARARRTSS